MVTLDKVNLSSPSGLSNSRCASNPVTADRSSAPILNFASGSGSPETAGSTADASGGGGFNAIA